MPLPNCSDPGPDQPGQYQNGAVWRIARRGLLGGLLTVSTLALIPWSGALSVARPEDRSAFLAVSAFLVGRQALDQEQAARLFDGLAADDSAFPQDTRALLTIINAKTVDPLQLQQLLDGQNSPLAALPRKIVTAWCLGIVGAGPRARCFAYETALNAVMVADVLKPPTYAYGGYGSWAAAPQPGSLPAIGAPQSLLAEPGAHG
ncbi:MAG: sugar dehydrogenase complex small subunit [Candidatus Sphingomonas colombiensis]|nr:sugar dehydrogenase complex small subunit [Sphingomonas sp.]WEK44747.1 MAG: sugar dehydrogenase complex small subunit [Sphingomonas sp.]